METITDSVDPDGDAIQGSQTFSSEEDQEENEINRHNSKLVFSMRYLTLRMDLMDSGLSLLEVGVFSFIDQFLSRNKEGRFYFANEQIAEMFHVGEATIKRAFKTLIDNQLIEVSHKIKAGGGQIRFVRLNAHPNRSRRIKMIRLTDQNDPVYNNKKTKYCSKEQYYDEEPNGTSRKSTGTKFPLPEKRRTVSPNTPNSAPPPLPDKRDPRIDQLLEWVKGQLKIEDFADRKQACRNIGFHLVNLKEKIGKEEFLRRFKGIISDEFKRKNCNRISFIYREMKAFLPPKEVRPHKLNLLNPNGSL